MEIKPKIGETVTLRNGYSSYWLPPGLSVGGTAKEIRVECGGLVIEQNGKEWEISERRIDHRMLYEIRGRRLPEEHPEVAYRLKFKGGM